jgi:lysophospholipase L1-like esterase
MRPHLKLIGSSAQAVDLLLLGDSLAQEWPADLAQTLIESGRVANWGVSGDRTQNVLWRLGASQVQSLAPKIVLLLLGTNNLGWGDKSCAIAAGIDAVLDRIQQLWPKAHVLLIEVTPRGDLRRENDRRALNALLRSMTQRRPDLATFNADEIFSCEGQKACTNLKSDFLHFSTAGYQLLSSSIRQKSVP